MPPLLQRPFRPYFTALFALTAFELCFGVFYLQGTLGLTPCPMCVLQRCALLLIGLTGLAGALANRKPRLFAGIVTFFALLGLAIAARQTWIQLYPPPMSCSRSVWYRWNDTPLADWLPLLFRGEGECSQVDWAFLGLSIANWGFVTFVGITVVTVWLLLRTRRAAAN